MRDINCCNKLNLESSAINNFATFRSGNDCTLIIDVVKNKEKLDLKGQTIKLVSKNFTQTDNIIINKNIVTINLNNEITNKKGKVELELEITDIEGTLVTTSFFINIK